MFPTHCQPSPIVADPTSFQPTFVFSKRYSDTTTNSAPALPERDLFMNLDGKKKYKPVARKIKPVVGELPDKFRIIRKIVGDPLETLPILPTHSPPFSPAGRYTQERKDLFDKLNSGFLLSAERDLMHYFMMVHQDGFAWETSERGHFREDFFPPVDIPVVPHRPWVQRNIPIPPGLFAELC
jgi:hypothetical protein